MGAVFSDPVKKPLTADISRSSSDQMESSADYVDDEHLKKALKSLSKTLSKHLK
jgi:hypothetical protein